MLDQDKHLLLKLSNTVIQAGIKIMEFYKTDFKVEKKKDNSPITKADLAANSIITEELKKIDENIPILSEESVVAWNKRKQWEKYWLVDPLDGTKEFINKNGEFTVNISLISNHKPKFGLINVPISGEIYWGQEGNGSYFIDSIDGEKKLNVSNRNNEPFKLTLSRSHSDIKTQKIIDRFRNPEIIKKGSSLKFCSIASGESDIYPRIGPTCEWDTAAGHAIVENAGGLVLTLEGKALEYNTKESLINPNFIAYNQTHLANKILFNGNQITGGENL